MAERVYKDARKTVHNPFLACTHMHNHLCRSPPGLYPLLESSDPFGDIVRHMIAGKILKTNAQSYMHKGFMTLIDRFGDR